MKNEDYITAQIARATANDVAALNVLVNSAYRGKAAKQGWTTEADLIDGSRIDENGLRDLINREDTTVLLYLEEKLILGCVELRTEGNSLYLGMLSVKPDTQNKGIGKKLLVAAELHARRQHCNRIVMTVISVRQELIDWYVRHGYVLTGERKPFILPDTRFGVAKTQLEFIMLEKRI
jgi:ribosomal protein S18 acetylase RimI-like enzyme